MRKTDSRYPAWKRAQDMGARYKTGETLEQIGRDYGITRERVRQCLREHTNVTAADGGRSKRTQRRTIAKPPDPEMDARIMLKMPSRLWEQVLEIAGKGNVSAFIREWTAIGVRECRARIEKERGR